MIFLYCLIHLSRILGLQSHFVVCALAVGLVSNPDPGRLIILLIPF